LENNEDIIEKVSKLIDSIFRQALEDKTIKSDSDEREHLSLKFISYLTKFRNNPARAYFELKKILSTNKDVSLYFRTVSTVMS